MLITNSWSLLKLMTILLVMPFNHLMRSLSSPSPPTFSLSQHQGLFKRVGSLHQVTKLLEFGLSISSSNEYSGLIFFRMDWLDLSRDFQESSTTPQVKSINSLVLSFLHNPTLTSIHDYWKNYSFD